MPDYVYPSNAELQQIAQDKIPRLVMERLGFQVMPMVNADAAVLMWDQLDNFTGLQQVRGLNGQPGRVARTGEKRYLMQPGAYGEFSTIDEVELTMRRAPGTYGSAIDISDLVLMEQDRLLQRRLDRIEQIIWTLLATGTFSVTSPNGQVVHTDSYSPQTFNAVADSAAWSNASDSKPLQAFRKAQLLSRGHSVSFGAQARSIMNRATFNNLIAAVRRKAKLYHVFDLRRDDIDLTVRREDGTILRDDPLQSRLIREEEEQAETFDLLQYDSAWYNELSEVLANEEPVGLAEDLLIEAERALAQRFPRQAIATCHTAIEAAASALITKGMLKQGETDEQIDFVLSTRSLTSKLDVLLRQYSGFSLKRDQRELWRAFNRLNDLRNDIVHRGQEPTTRDAEFAIQVGRDLMRWLNMVRHRNR